MCNASQPPVIFIPIHLKQCSHLWSVDVCNYVLTKCLDSFSDVFLHYDIYCAFISGRDVQTQVHIIIPNRDLKISLKLQLNQLQNITDYLCIHIQKLQIVHVPNDCALFSIDLLVRNTLILWIDIETHFIEGLTKQIVPQNI